MEIQAAEVHFDKARYASVYSGLRNAVIALPSIVSPYDGYIPLSPLKNDLRFYSGSHQLLVWGRVLDPSGGRPIPNAAIEIWHLSPNTDHYGHRAKIYSDEQGAYRFITDLPKRERGKSYQVYFKITLGRECYFTSLSFNHSLAYLSSRMLKHLGHDAIAPELRIPKDNEIEYKFRFDIQLGGMYQAVHREQNIPKP